MGLGCRTSCGVYHIMSISQGLPKHCHRATSTSGQRHPRSGRAIRLMGPILVNHILMMEARVTGREGVDLWDTSLRSCRRRK